jgi:hypothetical protein
MNDPHDPLKPLTRSEKELLRSLRLLGELAPETAAEVRSAEGVWDDVTEDELPDSLRDAVTLAGSITSETSTILEMSFEGSEPAADAELQMARVARLGNDIPEEIERRMEQDRANARQHINDC